MVNPARQVFDPSLVMNKSKIIMNRFGSETNKIKSKNFDMLAVSGDGKTKVIFNDKYNVVKSSIGDLEVGQNQITILSDNKLKETIITLPTTETYNTFTDDSGRILSNMRINYDGTVIVVCDGVDGRQDRGEMLVYRFNGTSWGKPQLFYGTDDYEAFSALSASAISKDGSIICGGAYNNSSKPLRVFRYNGTSYIEDTVEISNIVSVSAMSLTNDKQEICVVDNINEFFQIYKYNNNKWSVIWSISGNSIHNISALHLHKLKDYRLIYIQADKALIFKLETLNTTNLAENKLAEFHPDYRFNENSNSDIIINDSGDHLLLFNKRSKNTKVVLLKTTNYWLDNLETSQLQVYKSPIINGIDTFVATTASVDVYVELDENSEFIATADALANAVAETDIDTKYKINTNTKLTDDNTIYSLINYIPYNFASERIISLIKVPYGNKTTFINGILDDVEYLE